MAVDGREHKREIQAAYRARHPEKVRERKRKYRATAKGRAAERAYKRKYRAENAEKIREYQKIYDRKRHKPLVPAIAHPGKRIAYRIVHKALRQGMLERQPCGICGKEPAQAHHEDYDRPLDIMWLCAHHHKEHHLSGG